MCKLTRSYILCIQTNYLRTCRRTRGREARQGTLAFAGYRQYGVVRWMRRTLTTTWRNCHPNETLKQLDTVHLQLEAHFTIPANALAYR